MRRLFIIRKDLHLSAGKLAAMVGHCCEAYWTNLLKNSPVKDNEFETYPCDIRNERGEREMLMYHSSNLNKMAEEAFNRGESSFRVSRESARKSVTVSMEISKDIWNSYVNGIFTKTICEARNKNHLLKAESMATELGLAGGVDFGFINDRCLTELTPENLDGTTTVGMWFRPLPDETAHAISKKFPLYRS